MSLLTTDERKRLRDLLIGHEGFSQYPYEDTTGHLSIGFGRNLTDRGVSHHEALQMLDNDISYFSDRLSNTLPFFNELDDVRKIVLIDMCFNLGVRGLLGFTRMLDAIRDRDYKMASCEMLASVWAEQVKGRAKQLANMMLTGEMSLIPSTTSQGIVNNGCL